MCACISESGVRISITLNACFLYTVKSRPHPDTNETKNSGKRLEEMEGKKLVKRGRNKGKESEESRSHRENVCVCVCVRTATFPISYLAV